LSRFALYDQLGQRTSEFGQNLLRMVARFPAHEGGLDRFVVKSGGSTRLVRTMDIDWIEAAGVYVNLHGRVTEIERLRLFRRSADSGQTRGNGVIALLDFAGAWDSVKRKGELYGHPLTSG